MISNILELCLAAFGADKPGENIPSDATHPSGTVCSSSVTIDIDALTWTSKLGSKSVTGGCARTGEVSACSPPFAACLYTDVVVCTSSICEQ